MASTCIQTLNNYPNNMRTITLDCSADSNGIFDATPIEADKANLISGCFLQMVETLPGSPAPTHMYDITLENPNGLDIMGGSLSSRSAIAPEQATRAYLPRPITDVLTLKISNNSVAYAVVKLVLYFSK